MHAVPCRSGIAGEDAQPLVVELLGAEAVATGPLRELREVGQVRAPRLLGRIAGDEAAYSYLPSSVKRFPDPHALAAELATVGLEDIRWVLTAGGIIAIHAGTVAT